MLEGLRLRHVVSKVCGLGLYTVNPIKLETGLRPNSAGIPYTFFLRIEAIGFPTFGLRRCFQFRLCTYSPEVD